MYHLTIQFSVWNTQFLPCVSLSVPTPGASTSRVITEVLLRFFFLFPSQMEKLQLFIIMAHGLRSATAAARWDASLSCVDAALPRPAA